MLVMASRVTSLSCLVDLIECFFLFLFYFLSSDEIIALNRKEQKGKGRGRGRGRGRGQSPGGGGATVRPGGMSRTWKTQKGKVGQPFLFDQELTNQNDCLKCVDNRRLHCVAFRVEEWQE